mmetsp:Transcript_17093/g.21592  ORF Transcript_17093/g.21592 Transcript_17093/m.21592 type:complete len:112 (+) Transcript_17093:542-877(+)|eukprot:CAMPEP_0170472568 /NCGR_PEP_ID=MMETSP0123-20130129/14590_1 /TAXON_ID=182087 /ORGANISM="Favella ehrenbergii, Strain Fehren 1" /LENGTH=111 /DNA_ID=CAMNT_0010740951 /DNA_START=715 /DNA_END=1050 /DNA_ORIENTATION=-
MARVARREMKLSQSSTFMHYFNMSGREMAVDPKFFFFSANQFIVGPLLHLMDTQKKVPLKPMPSSMFLFDFVKSSGKVLVKGRYVDGDQELEIFKMDSEDFQHQMESKLEA